MSRQRQDEEEYDFSDSGSHYGHEGVGDHNYEDDFSAANSDNQDQSPPRARPSNSGNDEQRFQKMQSQMDALQSQVEDLTMELTAEKNLHEATRARLEKKNSTSDELLTSAAATNAALQRAIAAEKAVELLQKELDNAHKISDAKLETLNKQLSDERKKSVSSPAQTPVQSSNGDNVESLTSRIKELQKLLVEKEAEIDRLKDSDHSNDSPTLSDNFREEISSICLDSGVGYELSDPSDVNETVILEIFQKIIQKNKTLQKKASTSGPSQALPRPIPQGSDSELQNRVMNLEEELRLALNAAEDIRVLKAKVLQLVGHIRHEKETRLKAESEVKLCHKKMNILSSHIEKLMAHLKHEATAKIKYMDQLKISEGEVQRVKQNVIQISKKSLAKDRLIVELREGSKVLEDQLRLMDEKYLELRTKLDWSREQANKRLRKAQKTASELRMKFMMAGNTMLLDSIPLPDINANVFSAGGYNNSQVSWDPSLPSSPNNGTRSPDGRVTAKSSGSGGTGGSYEQPNEASKRKSVGIPQDPSSSFSMASSKSMKDLNADPEASLNHILEKIRRHKHESQGWTPDKLNELINRR